MNNIEQYNECPVYNLFTVIINHIQSKSNKEYNDIQNLKNVSIASISINNMIITNTKLFDNFIIFDKIISRESKIRKHLNNLENLYSYIKLYYNVLQKCNIINNISTRYENINNYLINNHPDDHIAISTNAHQIVHKNAILNIYINEKIVTYNKILNIIKSLIIELTLIGDFIHSRIEYYSIELSKIIKKSAYDGFDKKYIILLVCVRRNYLGYVKKMMYILNCIQYLCKLKESFDI